MYGHSKVNFASFRKSLEQTSGSCHAVVIESSGRQQLQVVKDSGVVMKSSSSHQIVVRQSQTQTVML